MPGLRVSAAVGPPHIKALSSVHAASAAPDRDCKRGPIDEGVAVALRLDDPLVPPALEEDGRSMDRLRSRIRTARRGRRLRGGLPVLCARGPVLNADALGMPPSVLVPRFGPYRRGWLCPRALGGLDPIAGELRPQRGGVPRERLLRNLLRTDLAGRNARRAAALSPDRGVLVSGGEQALEARVSAESCGKALRLNQIQT
jgi:hypothetical protein